MEFLRSTFFPEAKSKFLTPEKKISSGAGGMIALRAKVTAS